MGKKLQSIMVSLSLAFLAACNNGSLFEGNPAGSINPPEGKLFAQVRVESTQDLSQSFMGGKDRTNNVEDVYEIHVDEAALILGHLSFETSIPEEAAALGVIKFHAGEDHSGGVESVSGEESHDEPTSCNFENTFSSFQHVDLKEGADLPCVTLNEGTYAGLKLLMQHASGEEEVLDLPEGSTASIILTGTASKDGVNYPFQVQAEADQEMTVAAETEFSLNDETHHITLGFDVKSWFHGVDFSQLEMVDGVVVFSEDHNSQRFEHMVFDHVPGAMSLAVGD